MYLVCDQVTGHTFEVETDTFKLRNIMEAPLLKYKEEIEVRTNSRVPMQAKRYRKACLFFTAYSGWQIKLYCFHWSNA